MTLRSSARAVQRALDAAGLELEVVELPASTRTAPEAAEAVGCTVGQIAKSIVFTGRDTGEGVLVVASGANRIREGAIAAEVAEELRMATPDEVRAATGFVIGGVPPCGHPRPVRTFLDRDLFHQETIWAAAGTPHALFRLTPADLERLTGGTVLDVG